MNNDNDFITVTEAMEIAKEHGIEVSRVTVATRMKELGAVLGRGMNKKRYTIERSIITKAIKEGIVDVEQPD